MIDNQLQIKETDPKLIALIERLRKTPLIERLDKSYDILAKLFAEERQPKRSIPAQFDDEDFYVGQTLMDAKEAIEGYKHIAVIQGVATVSFKRANETGTALVKSAIEDKDFWQSKYDEAMANAGKPIDMLLFCPNCGEQHVDEAKPDLCETCGKSKRNCSCAFFTAWLNPPHKSHRCSKCNHVFRPANVPTNGVAEIKTKGERDGNPVPQTNALRSELGIVKAQLSDAKRSTEDWKSEANQYANAWQRELGGKLINKHHLIDALVLTTRELVKEKRAAERGCEDLKEIKTKLSAHFDTLPGDDVLTGVDQLLNEITECNHYIALIRELFDYGDEPIDLATFLIQDVNELKAAAKKNASQWWQLFTDKGTKVLAQKLASDIVERSGEENPQQCALLREAIFHAICKAVDVQQAKLVLGNGPQGETSV